jgi:hypothetical protein
MFSILQGNIRQLGLFFLNVRALTEDCQADVDYT